MDQTDSDALQQTLSSQETLLRKHDHLLGSLMENSVALAGQVNDFSTQLSVLTSQLSLLTSSQPSSSPAAAVSAGAVSPISLPANREPHTVDPEPYTGDPLKCKPFLLQCSLVLSQKPFSYSTDESRIQYIVGLLQGRALDWATALWEVSPVFLKSYSLFVDEFKKVFDHSVQNREAASQLLSLRQGSRSVADYSIEFRVLAAGSGWNDAALRGVFFKGLSEQLKDELAVRDETASLDSLISLAVRLDNRLRERRRERSFQPPAPRSSSLPAVQPLISQPSESPATRQPLPTLSRPSPDPEPMQLGRARLSPEERLRRMSSRECLYCGQKGHFIASCPQCPKTPKA